MNKDADTVWQEKEKQQVYHISDTDITFGEAITYEEAQRRFIEALYSIGVTAIRGGV